MDRPTGHAVSPAGTVVRRHLLLPRESEMAGTSRRLGQSLQRPLDSAQPSHHAPIRAGRAAGDADSVGRGALALCGQQLLVGPQRVLAHSGKPKESDHEYCVDDMPAVDRSECFHESDGNANADA